MSKKITFFLFSLLMAFACDDILEKDISDKAITLHTPPDELSTPETDQLFWWEALDGATSYQVLIASPDFQNPTALLLDSTVTNDKLSIVLPVGDYEWCIRGKNSAYETAYACRKLYIIN
jgi:hypothetical protein